MFAAVTDHVFLDGGHTIDFTNKAFEVLDHLGWDAAATCCPRSSRRPRRPAAARSRASWRYPARPRRPRCATAAAALPDRLAAAAPAADRFDHAGGVAALAWAILAEDPAEVVGRDRRRRRRPARRPRSSSRARRLRGRAADHPLPHPERPRRLGRGAPRLHRRQRAAPGARWAPDARAAARRVPRRAAGLPRPLPQRPRGPAAGRAGRRRPAPTSAELAGVLGPGGPGRRSRGHRLPLPTRRRRPGGRRSPRSATPCSPRTPSSTGSRPTRRPCASSTPGPPDPRRAR